ncbi:MAG TPA: phage tail tube protein [Telluria sp.]|nr:phage tail tube protein [Telluria sp.]
MKLLSHIYAPVVRALAMLVELIVGPPRVIRRTGLRYGTKNAAVSTAGFKLEVSVDDGTTWLEVSQNTDIPDVAQEASDLDATNLQSTAKEYIAGLKDSQSVTLTGQRVVLSVGQNALRDNAGAVTAFKFRNTYSDGSILSYSATIKKFGVTGGTDAVMMFTATIRPSGAQIWSGTGGPTT